MPYIFCWRNLPYFCQNMTDVAFINLNYYINVIVSLIFPADVQSSITNEECKRQRLSLNSDFTHKEEPADSSLDLTRKSTMPPDFSLLPPIAPGPTPPFDFGTIPSIPDPLRYAEIFAR